MKTHITLGVDPGIANTGLAIVEANGTRSRGCEISIRCGTCAACLICAGYSTERHRIPHASATTAGYADPRKRPQPITATAFCGFCVARLEPTDEMLEKKTNKN